MASPTPSLSPLLPLPGFLPPHAGIGGTIKAPFGVRSPVSELLNRFDAHRDEALPPFHQLSKLALLRRVLMLRPNAVSDPEKFDYLAMLVSVDEDLWDPLDFEITAHRFGPAGWLAWVA